MKAFWSGQRNSALGEISAISYFCDATYKQQMAIEISPKRRYFFDVPDFQILEFQVLSISCWKKRV